MKRKNEIEICLGSSCFSRGNRDTVQIIKEYLKKNHLDDKVILKGARCMDRCNEGPFVIINGRMWAEITPGEIERILDREFMETGSLT